MSLQPPLSTEHSSISSTNKTMFVLVILGPKCTLAASRADTWWVTLSMRRRDRQTDGQTDARQYAFRYHADSVSNLVNWDTLANVVRTNLTYQGKLPHRVSRQAKFTGFYEDQTCEYRLNVGLHAITKAGNVEEKPTWIGNCKSNTNDLEWERF